MTSPAPLPAFYVLTEEQIADMLTQAAERGAQLALSRAPASLPEGIEPLYTVAQVAALRGESEQQIRGQLRRGELRGVRRGRHWRVPESALRAGGS